MYNPFFRFSIVCSQHRGAMRGQKPSDSGTLPSLRRNLVEGNVCILVSCSPSNPKVDPFAYKQAVQDGARHIIAAFLVIGRAAALSRYHACFTGRLDQWYGPGA